MAYGLGIDVGTTFTGAALAYETHMEMLPLGATALVAPSVVFASRDGRLLTGEAAARLAESEPGRAVHEFKRRLGDPTPIVLGDRQYSPTQLIAAVVRDVVARAREVTGEQPGAVVLTCPAIWGPYRLEQFTEVPALSGLTDCRVITEPEAAAAFYLSGHSLAANELAVVYDFGGGTFDTAVVRAVGDDIELVGNAEGVDGTGGADLDEVVLAMVDEQLDGAVSRLLRDPSRHGAVLARLRADAVRAKEALSSEPVVTMPFFLADGPHEVRLRRTEFELRVGPILDPTIEAVWRALVSAGVDPAQLHAILLSGGSSRVPLVARRLEEEFARPVRTFGHPKHVVALGAAALAHDAVRTRPPGRVAAPATVAEPAPPADARVAQAEPAGAWSADAAGTEARWPVAHSADDVPARRPPILRTVAAAALTIVTLVGLLAGAIWLSMDRSPGGPVTAPLGDNSLPATGPTGSPVSGSPTPGPTSAPASTTPASSSPPPTSHGATPSQSSSPPAVPPSTATTGTSCEAGGSPTWDAGHLGLGMYEYGQTGGVRQANHDGQAAWFVGHSYQLSRWSNRGRGYIRIGHAYLAMEVDGDLALYTSPHNLSVGPACAAWRTGTGGHPGAYLWFQPDGNLVLYTADHQPLWASNTCCDPAADTFVVRADGNLLIMNLASHHVYWSSEA